MKKNEIKKLRFMSEVQVYYYYFYSIENNIFQIRLVLQINNWFDYSFKDQIKSLQTII